MRVSKEEAKVQYCRSIKDCRPCASMGSCLSWFLWGEVGDFLVFMWSCSVTLISVPETITELSPKRQYYNAWMGRIAGGKRRSWSRADMTDLAEISMPVGPSGLGCSSRSCLDLCPLLQHYDDKSRDVTPNTVHVLRSTADLVYHLHVSASNT